MKLSMKRGAAAVMFAALAACLAGCRSDSASYMINGADHSLTLIVEQDYFWEDEWQLGLLTTRQPDCMRRHKLKPAPRSGLKLDVFQAGDGGVFIIREGANWYVAETKKCQLQAFKTVPAEPGELMGSFEFKEEKLRFVAVPKPVAPVPPAAAATDAAALPAATAPAEAAPAPIAPTTPAAASLVPPPPAAAPAGR